MPKAKPAAPPVISSAKALAELERRNAQTGPTVKVRAIQKGYYGRPVADIIEPGTVFKFAVKDLVTPGPDFRGRTITHGGMTYALPTWCEDAATPMATDDEDEDDAPLVGAGATDQDVI